MVVALAQDYAGCHPVALQDATTSRGFVQELACLVVATTSNH